MPRDSGRLEKIALVLPKVPLSVAKSIVDKSWKDSLAAGLDYSILGEARKGGIRIPRLKYVDGARSAFEPGIWAPAIERGPRSLWQKAQNSIERVLNGAVRRQAGPFDRFLHEYGHQVEEGIQKSLPDRVYNKIPELAHEQAANFRAVMALPFDQRQRYLDSIRGQLHSYIYNPATAQGYLNMVKRIAGHKVPTHKKLVIPDATTAH